MVSRFGVSALPHGVLASPTPRLSATWLLSFKTAAQPPLPQDIARIQRGPFRLWHGVHTAAEHTALPGRKTADDTEDAGWKSTNDLGDGERRLIVTGDPAGRSSARSPITRPTYRGALTVYTRLCGKVPPMPYMEVEAEA